MPCLRLIICLLFSYTNAALRGDNCTLVIGSKIGAVGATPNGTYSLNAGAGWCGFSLCGRYESPISIFSKPELTYGGTG